jgi:hypothetical protein
LLSDFSKQFTLPACFGLCAKVLVRTQLLRFQLVFPAQHFFGFHIKFTRVHSWLTQDFAPVLRSAVPFFPAENFRFCRRFFFCL